jgi:hypothetical protein
MKQEKVQKISTDLLWKTGVDFSRYRNEELFDTISNAVTFPLYFARTIGRSVGFLIAVTIAAALLTGSGWFKTFLVFPGLILALINGILLGLVVFIRRVRNDMNRLFEISSDLSIQVVKDISVAKSKLTGASRNLPSLFEIFHGVNAVIILPMLIRIMDRKIPLLGGLMARITERFFNVVNDRLTAGIKSKSDDIRQFEIAMTPEQYSSWIQKSEDLIRLTRDGISQVVNKVAGIVAFPFLTVFVIILVVTLTIVYGAYTMLG